MALCPIPGLSLPAPLKRILLSARLVDDSVGDAFIFNPSTNGDATIEATSLPYEDIQASNKPLETTISPDSLGPDADLTQLAQALDELVANSGKVPHDVGQGTHAHAMTLFKIPWMDRLVPGLEKLAAVYHIGNFVIVRSTGVLQFESMPIYARIGMHLIFYGTLQTEVLQTKTVGTFLKNLSIKQGKIYDSPESVKSIPSFIATYGIKLDQLLEPDLKKYRCFNEFFYRKLKPDARPVRNAEEPLGICSSADCRLVVYPALSTARDFWVKGKTFNVHNLLDVPLESAKAQRFVGGSIAIFRLAPQDYHRFHCPVDGVVGEIHNVEGQYYTVNPQAINQSFDVLTENARSVLYLTHTSTGKEIAVVAVGALLVGSIIWTKGSQKGSTVRRGEELGYFAYGGSTVIVIFPKGCIKFDDDLLENSKRSLETLVKVGDSIGRTPKSVHA